MRKHLQVVHGVSAFVIDVLRRYLWHDLPVFMQVKTCMNPGLKKIASTDHLWLKQLQIIMPARMLLQCTPNLLVMRSYATYLVQLADHDQVFRRRDQSKTSRPNAVSRRPKMLLVQNSEKMKHKNHLIYGVLMQLVQLVR